MNQSPKEESEAEKLARDREINEAKNNGAYDSVQRIAYLRQDLMDGLRILLIALVIGILPGLIQHAAAGIISHMPNIAGGKIMLSDTACPSGNGGLAISNNPSGDTITGCWVYHGETEMVSVTWETGAFKVFNRSDFELTSYAIEKYGRGRKPAARRQGSNL